MSDSIDYSVVVPVYWGAACLNELHARLTRVLVSLGGYEIVLVDDGSPDDAWPRLRALAAADSHVHAVRLSRNFGQMRAIAAGLAHTRGNRVIVMDCDLQDPPEAIPRLVLAADGGRQIVYVRRTERADGTFKRATSWLFFVAMKWLSQSFLRPGIGSFSLLDRKAVDAYLRVVNESSHYLQTLHWLGFASTTIDVPQAKRFAGRSSYTLRRLLRHAADGIVSQSTRLLHVSTMLGFMFSAFSMYLIGLIVYRKVIYGISVQGWASLIATTWFIGGVILFSLGVLGLYLGRLFERSNARPIYLIDEIAGGE